MRTIELKLFKFDELDENAQQTAIDHFRNLGDLYHWHNENQETLKAFIDLFPVNVSNWEYGYRYSINWTFTDNEDIESLSGVRLLKYLINNYGNTLFKGKYYSTPGFHVDGKFFYKKRYSNCQTESSCVLTGYGIDDDILEPIYKFLKAPDTNITFYDLMNDCLQSWVFACHNDFEGAYTDESIKDTITANEYEFLDDGTLN